MKFITSSILALAFMSFGASAIAAGKSYAGSSNSVSYGGSHQHAFSGGLGFYGMGATNYQAKVSGADVNVSPAPLSGLFGLGLDYEYILKDHLTVGGLFRYYSTSDSLGTGTTVDTKTTVLSLGGIVRGYMDAEDFKFFLGTGLGILSITYNSGPTSYDIPMGFGFYIDGGVLYKINDQFSLGIEHLRALAVGDKINGTPIADYLIKGRFTL